MGLFGIFGKQSYANSEYRGDRFFRNKDFGSAKLEYENALKSLTDKSSQYPAYHRERIENKLEKTRENLALQHKETAENLIESRSFADAEELLKLASELTQKKDLSEKIEALASVIETEKMNLVDDYEPDYELLDESHEAQTDEDYFIVLCHALTEDEKEAYMNYGDVFKKGYVALNHGDFMSAAELLSQAMEDQKDQVTYIHLELATAFLNLGHTDQALGLLERFLDDGPESIRAYEMMCDILWEKQDYAQALKLLTKSSDQLKSTVGLNLLLGETLTLAGNYSDAKSLYFEYIQLNGWNRYVAAALAGTYEVMGQKDQAKDLYGKVINECQGCGQSADPYIKQRFAELSYEAGQYSDKLNELYLSLCREDPDNRSFYYERISDIYSRSGHHDEAERFRILSEKLKREN